jgi:hypothetical protein
VLRRLEVDTNYDGKADRWEAYDGTGALVSVGTSRSHGDKPDVWTFPGISGRTRRVDRWQDWGTGRLASEDLDIDADGKPDRRMHYDKQGRFARLETLR